MGGWLSFWVGLLIAGLCLYAALSVAVAIGGIFDIRTMFRSLDEQHRKPGEETNAGGSSSS